MPAIFRTKLYQQEQSIKMDNIASAAPMVGVVALAAAFLQENSRRTYLAIAAAAIAVGSMKYLFPEKEENKAEAKKEETKKATDSAAEAAAAAAAAAAAEETAEKAKKAAEYAAAEKALYEQDGPAAADETAGTEAPAPATTEKEEEKEAAEEEDDAPIVPEAVKFVVCFDFDKCLMSDHWWGRYKNADIKGVNPSPNDFAHDDIGDLLERLFNMDGVQVAVASFGRRDVIYKAIASAVGTELADTVYITTPGDFDGYRDGFSMGESYKNAELEKLCNDIGVEPNQVIFFDDSEPNISHACDMGVNAHVTAPFLRIHEKHIAEHLGLESVV